MNTSQLSSYAPKAGNDFITAVSAQAACHGITADGSAPAERQGDVLLIGGQAFPAYKRCPIYWLFSSGKLKVFQGLVYLHRYNEGTLSWMRSEYVIPLQGKMATRLEKLKGDIQAATSTAQRKRLEKERAKLEKQQVELLAFDEKLRHYADNRISLDLDDGVKVNYGRFGDLLAEVTTMHGKKAQTG